MSEPSPLELESPHAQARWLTRGCVQALPEDGLAAKLAQGRPLRVKLGLDPTAPDIHLGHTVVLQRLAEFQQLGHEVVLIIGDFTARVGDPSGRSATRPVLTPEQIDAAAATYAQQAFRVLDPSLTQLRRNSEWLNMPAEKLFELMRVPTVAQLLERNDFQTRFSAQTPISLLELLYPVIQGYDSVAVSADVELGGTDQTFNLLLARDIQRHYGVPEQACLTLPLLTGLDGEQKMSKSLGNYIGVTEDANEIFGKAMSLPDAQLPEWFRLLLDSDVPGTDPYQAKRELARRLADRFAGEGAGLEGEAHFDRVHVDRQAPETMPEVHLHGPEVHLPALLADCFGVSRAQARRDLQSGGVRLDGVKLPAQPLDVAASELTGRVLQRGKRNFVRLR